MREPEQAPGGTSVFLVTQDIARSAINARFIDDAIGLAPFDFPVAFVIGFGAVDFDIPGLGLGGFNGFLDGDPARTRFIRQGCASAEQRWLHTGRLRFSSAFSYS